MMKRTQQPKKLTQYWLKTSRMQCYFDSDFFEFLTQMSVKANLSRNAFVQLTLMKALKYGETNTEEDAGSKQPESKPDTSNADYSGLEFWKY